MASQGGEQPEPLLRRALELLPNMCFAKDGSPATRDDYDRGFRYVYFNSAMDHASGFDRTAMIGQNAKDHFPTHYKRYFDDDRQVMALPPIPPGSPDDGSAVLEIYEPWKVRTGDHVVHTRKVNLGDSYMLGAFILVDDVHLGKQLERRRPALPPKSPTPSGLEPGFFTQAFEALPIPVLVSVRGGGPLVLKNAAYQQAFAGDEEAVDAFFRGLDTAAVLGEIYERSGVELKGTAWHVAQRPIGESEGDGPIEMVVYAIWGMADPARTAEARAALTEDG